MLKLFRQRKFLIKGMLWTIVLVVGGMMVVTLVPGLQSCPGRRDLENHDLVAQVGPREISREEVLRRLEQLQARQGGLSSPFFRRFVAEQLIDELVFRRAVEQEAERLGLQVTHEEVEAELRKEPGFYEGGKFIGLGEYQRRLQQLRMTVDEFEADVRTQRLVGKLSQLLTDGLRVTEPEIEQEFRARNEKVAVEFALFKPQALEVEIQPKEEELRAYFGRQTGRYALAERRRVRYVLVDFDWVRQKIPVRWEELEAHYRRSLESYRVAERVRFRHLLLRFPDQATSEQKEKTRAEARRLRAELARGKDFGTVAKKHSADKVSAEKDGDAGWVTRGQVVGALEDVLFSLPPGALSEPVETGYGIHIVRVTDHEQARLKPFEEVQGEIEAVVAEQKSQQEALNFAQRLAQAVRGGQGGGKTLAATAEALGLTAVESPLFGLSDSLPGFAGNTAIQEAAFRLKRGEVSESLSVPSGYVVLELVEQRPATEKPDFQEVRAEVERGFRQERTAELARQRAEALAGAARKSGNLRAAARAARVEVTLSSPFTRDGSIAELGPARTFAAGVFRAPVGSLVGPVRIGANWAVLRVAARQEADPKALERERGLISADLIAQKRQVTYELFRESLRKRLKENGQLQINQAAVDRILGPG